LTRRSKNCIKCNKTATDVNKFAVLLTSGHIGQQISATTTFFAGFVDGRNNGSSQTDDDDKQNGHLTP